MRDIFWGTYQSLWYKRFFYLAWMRRAETLSFWSRVVCAVVSIISVLVWSISKSLPVLWACLIALAQIVQTLLGYLPWEKQRNALVYMLPELNALLADLHSDWLRLGYAHEDNDEALSSAAALYDRRFYELENRYTNGIWFPRRKRIMEETEADWDRYMSVRFDIPKGDEQIVQKETGNS